jgi:DNA-binding beta-propeller fold protein YncE
VQPVARPVASGVSSADPVLLLASGLNGPDDLLYTDDGTVLVGEHGDGHIARVGGPAGFLRLPQVVPEAEGIAQVNGTTYIADQFNARVVALTDTGVRTVLQLQPVASGENLDGIAADLKGSGLIVPDSPHGTVLQVDLSGKIVSRVGGFSRPAGAAPDPSLGGYLIADENASAVFELNGGTVKRLAGGLPGVDDAVRDQLGHLLVILPASGRLFDVTSGGDLARGLRNPQGLGFDGAQNVLVTESDNGRLDLVVTTFAIEVPSGVVQLKAGQGVCYGILRAPGNTDNIRVYESIGALPLDDPAVSAQGEVIPGRCNLESCTVTLVLQGPTGLEYAYFTYRD